MMKLYFVKKFFSPRSLLTTLFILISFVSYAQNVGINSGGQTPDASAGLDVNFTNKGLLIPRVSLTSTTDVITVPSPTTSLLVYNTANSGTAPANVVPGYYYFNGSLWVKLSSSSTSAEWSISGSDLYYTAGKIGIGTTSPSYKLHIDGAANPLFLGGVEEGESTDSLLTISSGLVKKLPFGSLAQWTVSGSNIHYTSGNVGIGTSNPTHALHISAGVNPLAIDGVQEGTTADSLLTIKDGVVMRLAQSQLPGNTQWTTSGANVHFSTGNVGLGVTDPTYKLQIGTTADPLFLSGVQEGGASDSLLTIYDGVVRKLPQSDLGGATQWGNSGSSIYYTNGNVGLGTSNPAYPLDISADSDPLHITGIQAGTIDDEILSISEGVVRSLPSSSFVTYIGSNVGIGTTNPTSKLTIEATSNALTVKGLGTSAASDEMLTINNSGLVRKRSYQWTYNGSHIVYSAGNVGIGLSGSTSPSYKFQIGAPNNSNPLMISGIAPGSTTDSILTITGGVVRKLPQTGLLTTAWTLSGNSGTSTNFIGTTNTESLRFRTVNTQRMIIDTDGSVGIGTAAFSTEKEKLLIDAGSAKNAVSIKGNVNAYMQFNVQNNNSTTSASTDIVATSNQADGLNYINLGINGTGNTQNKWGTGKDGYLFVNEGELLVGTTTSSKSIYFITADSTKSSAKMMISHDGTVSVGTNSPESGYKFFVNGNAKASSWVSTSDGRLKKNIQPLGYGLKSIMSLRPVSYNWIDPSQSSDLQLGLIAQDAKKVIPEIVQGDESKEKLGINYTELIPVLINAIKEQQAKIEALEKRVEELGRK